MVLSLESKYPQFIYITVMSLTHFSVFNRISDFTFSSMVLTVSENHNGTVRFVRLCQGWCEDAFGGWFSPFGSALNGVNLLIHVLSITGVVRNILFKTSRRSWGVYVKKYCASNHVYYPALPCICQTLF